MNVPWYKPRAKSPILFGALLALLLWLPIPLASNRSWSWAVMEVWIYLLCAVWLVQYSRGRVGVSKPFRKAKPALVLAALWLVYGIFQMVPLPSGVVKALSPNGAEMYQKANLAPALAGRPITPDANGADVFVLDLDHVVALLKREDPDLVSTTTWHERAPPTAGLASAQSYDANVLTASAQTRSAAGPPAAAPTTQNHASPENTSSESTASLEPNGERLVPYRLTLDIHASIVAWLKSLAYVLLFALTLLLVDSVQRLKLLTYALILSGMFQAVYGALSVAIAGSGVATGTFVNRNHFAAYLVLCLAAGIGLLISWTGERQENRSWRRRVRDIARLILSPKAPLRIFLAIMVIALVLTHSRMGNTSFFVALLIAGVLALVFFKHSPRSTILLISSLLVVDIVIIGSYVGVERVRERIEQTALETETRDEVDIYSWELVKDYPVVGTGAGSYYGVFPRYQGPDVGPRLYDHAHNDYLEFMSEYGAVGISLLGLIVALALWNALITARTRHHPMMRGTAFAVTMAIVAMLIHASVEFNLQIPAYAATFVVVLAMAWLARHLSPATIQ
jgi:O-antigen ligase